MTADGAVAINVGRTDTDRRLVDALTATLQEVFPTVHALDVPQVIQHHPGGDKAADAGGESAREPAISR